MIDRDANFEIRRMILSGGTVRNSERKQMEKQGTEVKRPPQRCTTSTPQSQSPSAKLHFLQLLLMCFLIRDIYFKVTLIQLISELILSLALSHSCKPTEIPHL